MPYDAVIFDLDTPGKDSWRHRAAGATEVLVASSRRWALLRELRGEPDPPLEMHLARLAGADLVLVEGWKAAAIPKIEVHRAALLHPLIAPQDPTIRALATDTPLALDRPQFGLDDIAAIAAFILRDLGP